MTIPLVSCAQETSTVVFLVRHAEKESGKDPSLNPAGIQRANELAGMLRDAGISQIHSTDYARTRETAAPLAERLSLPVRLYDPGKLDEFAALLIREGGRYLVVGHSNTTPELAERLGGDPGPEIDEPGEYDRLYVISIAGEQVSSVMLRYGKAFVTP